MPASVAPSAIDSAGYSEAHWRSLRYFNLYRLLISVLLFASALLHPSIFSVLSPDIGHFHLAVTSLYLLATVFALIGTYRYRQRFNLQLSLQVIIDILVMTVLMHTGGGLRSGFGTMLLVTLAGAGLVGQGRLVSFYAASATLAVLFEQSYRTLFFDFDAAGFFQAGVFSAGCFAVAISARLLARRVIANEDLARQRGIELKNQMLVSQRVIEEMQDGVLVLDRRSTVKQHNPRAGSLLGLNDAGECLLTEYSPVLAEAFFEWMVRPSDDPILVRGPAGVVMLRARFVATESSGRDVLVFLEDMGRIQEQAQQLKLAALGRLTANIAHEIRNPLSAISHAGELLLEDRRSEGQGRLLRIVLDNAQRLARIVRDVLELGRRDQAYREPIRLREYLLSFVEELAFKEKIGVDTVQLEFSGDASICFDRSHFHQVLWNLLGNALRHSQRFTGSVRVRVQSARLSDRVEIHVLDDGEGVGDTQREQVFEPFFTTQSRGTGLGLYIARELCDANGARLELLGNTPGAHFCITGRSEGCL
ncbi:MAG: PAS domain-containing protein [Betaproteobacteria bacterium]|nr:PAS domain-containing protein [Betaproteobacteria bacterium]